MTVTWDNTKLPIKDSMWARKNLSRSGGLTITGIEQVVQSSNDFWVASIGFSIRRTSELLYYRSLQAQNWGRAGQWIIPACPNPGVPPSPPAADYSWSDDWSIDFSIGPAPSVIPAGEGALVTASAVLGATSLTMEFIDPTFAPLAGMFFSIGNRLYLIGVSTLVGVRRYTVSFAPKLRLAAPIDTIVNFSTPNCLMRLASDDAGQMNLNMLRFADLSLNFVEAPL